MREAKHLVFAAQQSVSVGQSVNPEMSVQLVYASTRLNCDTQEICWTRHGRFISEEALPEATSFCCCNSNGSWQ